MSKRRNHTLIVTRGDQRIKLTNEFGVPLRRPVEDYIDALIRDHEALKDSTKPRQQEQFQHVIENLAEAIFTGEIPQRKR